MAQDQRVEFLFAAQVTGQNEMQKLIASVDALRRETEQLKSANAGLSSSTDAVIRNGVRYNNALDAQSKALRQTRQGTQQLGLQINDFATSVATGASPLQAFNQQIGQVGYAMSQMGGTAGVVGSFLAGPWGAALTIATAVLVPLIMNLFQASDAAKELKESEDKVRDSSIAVMFAKAELDKALGKNIDSYILASNTAIQAGLDDLQSAKDTVAASLIRMQTAKKEAQVLTMLSKIGGPTGQATALVAGLFGFGDRSLAVKESNSATDALNKQTEKVLNLITARKNALNPRSRSSGGRSRGLSSSIGTGAAGSSAKEKAPFSMLGFYEEFFAKEFQQNNESLAKIAETQIKSLLDTLPELSKISPEMEKIISRNEEVNQSFENIGTAVANSYKGMITGAMSFRDAMKGIIGAIIDELFRLYVVQQVVGVVKGALGSVFGVPTLPGKALGGSVTGNKPYMVGERGPELFVPGGNGTIIPNGNMRGGSGGGNSINVSVDARGSSDPAAVRAQVQQGILEAAPAIIAAAESRTVAGLRRPRLGGVMQ